MIRYDAGVVNETPQAMVIDAKVRLSGTEAPSIQIGNVKQLEDYVRPMIADCAAEEFHLICVNTQCMVLAEACVGSGTVGEVAAPLAKIAQIALLSNATAVFLAHNHPGGTCAPSFEDQTSTITISKALKLFDIKVLDHIIVTNHNGSYSFAQHGDSL